MVSLSKYVRLVCTTVTRDKLFKKLFKTLHCFNYYHVCSPILDSKNVNYRRVPTQINTISRRDGSTLVGEPIVKSIENILIEKCLCSEDDATNLATRIRPQCSSTTDVLKNYGFLRENGISNDSIRSFPWVLGYNSANLSYALNCIEIFHEDLNLTLPLLSIPFVKLITIVKIGSAESEYFTKGGKIIWLSQLFQCDVQLLCQKVAQHTYILPMSPERILTIVDILIDGGICPSSIVYDLSVFRCCPDTLLKRTAVLKNSGIKNLRPWCLRISEEKFHRMVERNVESQKLLGYHKSNKDYLAAKLECGSDTVSEISEKIPQVEHISPQKIKRLLDFLFEKGYTSEEICSMPRILTRSVDTLQSRVEELQKLNCKRITLFMLCKTRKEYSLLVKKWKTK